MLSQYLKKLNKKINEELIKGQCKIHKGATRFSVKNNTQTKQKLILFL
ncbi:hypothetical protein GvMRE_I2g427 [endosymbiont GvMRE of Glomus versiforme]|nr:hypothetical protein GvMRE_I2g427 [endosymbiont GvMRE of Glomus versiforme]